MRRVILTATAVVIAATLLVGATAHSAPTSVFVTIGNPNDAADATNTSHGLLGAYGYGKVDYVYEISQTAVSIAEWAVFYGDGNSNKVGTFNTNYDYWNKDTQNVGLNAPAVHISFNQAAQYVNWLTTGNATLGAYTIDGSGAVTGVMSRGVALATYGIAYLIPTEDEWYKAAYYKPDGSGYSLYADGGSDTDSPPQHGYFDANTGEAIGWNYYTNKDGFAAFPPNYTWTVGSGTEEQNGTFNMMGNVYEWNEAIISSNRGLRGGAYNSYETAMSASSRSRDNPSSGYSDVGFRVARVTPEPGGVGALVGMAAVGFLWFWRRR